jgi:hypothetical protein
VVRGTATLAKLLPDVGTDRDRPKPTDMTSMQIAPIDDDKAAAALQHEPPAAALLRTDEQELHAVVSLDMHLMGTHAL